MNNTVAPPLVSVITPVYNAEEYLAEMLDSVLASDYPNFEVVLVDDGSTDGSYAIASGYVQLDTRVRLFQQENKGACAARNHAISRSHGVYILPVDADDRISTTFLRHAIETISSSNDIKVVYPTAEFIGDRQGKWQLPPFSIRLLARRNMIPICGMYRKADWERVGGYCEEIIAREDWDFWISILKDGGTAIRLNDVEYYYRVHKGSKRFRDRAFKQHVVKVLNQRHPDFFERELGGPLHVHRSWSRLLNKLSKLYRRCH